MDASPYFAPTYFPTAYFPAATAPPSSSTGMSPYNAPTYFPASYFYGSSPSSPIAAPIVPEPKGRDQDAYASLLALLNATGVFEEVIFGAATQRGQAGADSYPLAIVTPKGWEESDDFDPTSIVRRAWFAITIVIKDDDSGSQSDQLGCLSAAVQGVLDRSDLDGNCLAPLTRIRAGRYEYATHFPEQSIDLEGEFSSIIDPPALAPY